VPCSGLIFIRIEFNQRFRCDDIAADIAYQYALQFTRPTVWVVCGLIASGKSTVAGALADALQINRF
jgi:adenylylsulfate kinase-like enzyme